MKSLKKTLVLLVVLSMILSAVSPVFAFNDVIDEDYAEQANKMAAFGVFTGDANGNFNAEENITRAEMAVVIGRLMGLTTNEANANQYYASNFSDVAAGEWYTGWVNLVAGRGIISGFPDGTFRPNEKVTQAQAVTMIVKALGWGVVVDQTGTWPANYITKASELRLFKNAVETNSELVTRGNVAIYCYNALTAKTWDVISSEDDKLTSGASRTETILAKYFSDFTNDAGDMKLVEDAKVDATGATTTKYGANQIVLSVEEGTYFDAKDNDIGIAGFIDAEDEPRKGKEEVTYAKGTSVVAYVPAEVANIANLSNKKVDVIFGKDNEVAYLEVVSDVVDNSFVTAWDYTEPVEEDTDNGIAAVEEDAEIEIDGEEYEFADYVTVTVYNTKINASSAKTTDEDGNEVYTDGLERINSVLSGFLVTDKTELKRNVVADIELNADDEIEAINFKLATYSNTTAGITVEEKIVEEVTAKKFVVPGTDLVIEDLEDKEPRVVKNNEVATLDDIEAGDVLTIITIGDDNVVIQAVSNTVEGTLVDYVRKTNALEIDSEEYKVVATPYYNVDGETDDYSELTINDVLTHFEDDEVTAYLNMFGEVVAVVGESEATGTVVGVVTYSAERLKDRSSKVYYLDLEILAEDGTKEFYSIYHKTSGKDMTAEDAELYEAGKVVVFSADEDGIIKSDKIEAITADGNYLIGNDTLKVDFVVADDGATANIDNERLNVGSEYKYTDSTVIINSNSEKEELISWKAFTQKETDADNLVSNEFVMFTKGTKLVYIIANLSTYGVSDEQYGIITAFGRDYDENNDRIYTVTLLTEGVEETYECEDTDMRDTYSVGDFVAYKVSDVTIADENISSKAKVDVVEALNELVDEDKFTQNILDMFATTAEPATTNYLDYIKVEAIDVDSFEIEYTIDNCATCNGTGSTGTVACPEEDHTSCSDNAPCAVCGTKTTTAGTVPCTSHSLTASRFVDLDEDVVVYNLVTGEMGEVSTGDYVLVLDTDAPAVPGDDYIAEYDIVIIVK